MSEADELSQHIAIINNGKTIALGTPSEIKKRFSKVNIIEASLRQVQAHAIERLSSIKGVGRVTSITDGPIQKLIIQVKPGSNITPEIQALLGENNIEYFSLRDPTLEEAYLSIIK